MVEHLDPVVGGVRVEVLFWLLAGGELTAVPLLTGPRRTGLRVPRGGRRRADGGGESLPDPGHEGCSWSTCACGGRGGHPQEKTSWTVANFDAGIRSQTGIRSQG